MRKKDKKYVLVYAYNSTRKPWCEKRKKNTFKSLHILWDTLEL